MSLLPRLEINLDAIQQNYLKFFLSSSTPSVAAVVKSDCYGLGAIPISETLYNVGCKAFYTAVISESLQLLPSLKDDVVISTLGGFFAEDVEHYYRDKRLVPILNSLGQIQLWRSHTDLHDRGAIIHIDTGMNRLGIRYDEWGDVQKGIDFKVNYIMSHLATAEDFDNDFALMQHQRIKAITGYKRSFINSAGFERDSSFYFDQMRIGIGLYGTGGDPAHYALSLEAPILQIRTVQPSETIGYGQVYKAKSTRRIATVGIGYNDGLPRTLGHHGRFSGWWNDNPLTICGRVSMDSLAVDISDYPEIDENQTISFLNSHQRVDDLAEACNTNPHEALTRLGGRVQKVHL